jgi:alpha-glucosidase
MNKVSFILLLIIISLSSAAQVTIVIDNLPENTPDDDFVYIAGSMNNWDPGNVDFKLQKNADDQWQIVLDEQEQGSSIEFKFTRGDWTTVEKGANGEEIPNRQFTYGNGEIQHIDILNWADQGSGGGQSTAAENVHIMDEAFYIPQLDRNRRIWIYLPPNYEKSSENYPVLYMHDGQNLFDQYTSYSGEWGVDETLNDLAGEQFCGS